MSDAAVPGADVTTRSWGPTPGRLIAWSRSSDGRPVVIGFWASTILVVAYLIAPLMGGDLSAQMARSEFTGSHPFALIDFRWFGGVLPFGYSLWTTYVMALLGPRLTGAIAAVISCCLTVRLFQRAGARRPAWGAVAAAVCQASNLAEGRVTYSCGMACGLAALLLIDSRRWVWAGVLCFLAGAASPVAALLLWVCCAALLIDRRWRPAVFIGVIAAIPTAVMVVIFGDGGPQPFNRNDFIRAALASILVAVVVPRRNRLIRYGAFVGLVMVVAAFVLHTSVGGNSMRLTLLFAVPIVVAMIDRSTVVAIVAGALAFVVQSPITWGTLGAAGKPQTHMSYYTPMIEQIDDRGPLTGRVQIPEMNGHWEAVFAARELPLARGWLRQADTQLNSDPFYGNPLNQDTYLRWLTLNAVEYVALPNGRLTHTGNRERTLLESEALPYLDKVWSNDDWTLWAVRDFTPIVDAPGTVTRIQPDRITVDVPADTTVTLRVRPFRWIDLKTDDSGAYLTSDGRWTVLHTGTGGRYVVSSALFPANGIR